MNTKPNITAYWGQREAEGSCNSCQTHASPAVLVVTLKHAGFQLCQRCARALANTLNMAIRGVQFDTKCTGTTIEIGKDLPNDSNPQPITTTSSPQG